MAGLFLKVLSESPGYFRSPKKIHETVMNV